MSLLLAAGCSNGVMPPNGYESYFIRADLTVSIWYDDASRLPDAFEDHVSDFTVDLANPLEEQDPTRYRADLLYDCDVIMVADGVAEGGGVRMVPVSLPVECSYVSALGETWDITFTTTDITWSEYEFDAHMSGPFISRLEGREDWTGTYSVSLRAL